MRLGSRVLLERRVAFPVIELDRRGPRRKVHIGQAPPLQSTAQEKLSSLWRSVEEANGGHRTS